MTATDMVSIIAAALVAHSYAGMDDQYADRCKCGFAGVGEAATADHQARAVLAAICEAAVGFVALGPDNLGGVEFVDCMPDIVPTLERVQSDISHWYDDATPYALIPWTAVEG